MCVCGGGTFFWERQGVLSSRSPYWCWPGNSRPTGLKSPFWEAETISKLLILGLVIRFSKSGSMLVYCFFSLTVVFHNTLIRSSPRLLHIWIASSFGFWGWSAADIHMLVCVWTHGSTSLGKMPRSGIPGLCGKCSFIKICPVALVVAVRKTESLTLRRYAKGVSLKENYFLSPSLSFFK